MRIGFLFGLAASLGLLIVAAIADDLPPSAPIIRVGPGVTPPKLLHKQEPEYSGEALDAGVQGKVVFDLVVSDTGKPVNIFVISPLGFGLDERAQAAIETWRFEPGRKDGKPVNIEATVEVNFSLQGRAYDRGAEERRTQFNIMLRALRDQNAARREKAVKTMQELAKKKLPAAMYVVGKLQEAGDGVPKGPGGGRDPDPQGRGQELWPGPFRRGAGLLRRQSRTGGNGQGLAHDSRRCRPRQF